MLCFNMLKIIKLLLLTQYIPFNFVTLAYIFYEILLNKPMLLSVFIF